MSAPLPRRDGDPERSLAVLLWSVFGAVAGAVVVTNTAERLAGPAHLPGGLFGWFTVTLGVLHVPVQGVTPLPWSSGCTVVAVGLLVVLVVALAAPVLLVTRRRGRRVRVDRAAAHMGRGRDMAPVSARAVRAKASRLVTAPGWPGLPIGIEVATGQPRVSGPEDVAVVYAGPRTGKTSSWAVPRVRAARGWVVATSNKRDLYDDTRDHRGLAGRVWTWDPQGIVGLPATWWWDPLSYVTDGTKAASLARVWARASRDPQAKTDAFFDGAGEEQLGHYLHAARLGGYQLPQVYRWLTRPTDDRPAVVLEGAGFGLAAASVADVLGAPDKQRAGIMAAARRAVGFLTNPTALAWVTGDPTRPLFDPEQFVTSTDTLYALSREGVGDTGPLTVALTVAVCEAAESYALACGGRLPEPGLVELDEAANVCRWDLLPDMASHYGSRGILLDVLLQSPGQAEGVWGRVGARKLWSSANVKAYLGGVAEVEWLTELSRLVGHYRVTEVSRSSSPGGGSSSVSQRTELTLDVSDLAGLPPGRGVVLASGAPATLVRTVPHWEVS